MRRSGTSPSTGSISSTRTAPRWSWRGPPRPECGSRRCATSSAGSDSGPRRRRATSRRSPAARRPASHWRCWSWSVPTCSCSTSRRIISTSSQALALALQSYSGALVLVSHDRHLLRLVSDSLWLVAGARAAPFEGDLDDYRRWLSERPAVMFVRDEAAGSRPSGHGVGGAARARRQDHPPSGTVATGGAGTAAGSPPLGYGGNGRPEHGGRITSLGYGGDGRRGHGGAGGRRVSASAKGGSVRRAAPDRRSAIRSRDAAGRRDGAGPARAPAAGGGGATPDRPAQAPRSTRWSADWPLWARSGRRSRRLWQMPPSMTKRSARGCVGCSCAAGGSTRRSRKVESLWLEKSEQLDAVHGSAAGPPPGAEQHGRDDQM